MIEVYTEQLAGIDVLHAVPTGEKERTLPTVVFYHGFTSSKLVYSYFAVALAQAGMRVILPDAQDHGTRYSGDEAARLLQYWPILMNNIDEFNLLYQAIAEKGWLDEGRLAVGGASMGGMTTLGIMARYPEVRSAACLMGSGYFLKQLTSLYPPVAQQLDATRARLEAYDPSLNLQRLSDRPLFLWHGEVDEVISVSDSQQLQQALNQQGGDKQLTSRWEAGVEHRITHEALLATVEFFRQHL